MSVFELARRAKLSHVGIICTKSDVGQWVVNPNLWCDNWWNFQDIKADEAKKDWKGQEGQDVARHIEAIARARQEKDNSKAELEDYGYDTDELSEGEKEEKRRLRKRSSQLE